MDLENDGQSGGCKYKGGNAFFPSNGYDPDADSHVADFNVGPPGEVRSVVYLQGSPLTFDRSELLPSHPLPINRWLLIKLWLQQLKPLPPAVQKIVCLITDVRQFAFSPPMYTNHSSTRVEIMLLWVDEAIESEWRYRRCSV